MFSRWVIFAAGLTACLVAATTGRSEPPAVLWAEPAASAPAPSEAAATAAASQPAADPLPGIKIDRVHRRVLLECTSCRPDRPGGASPPGMALEALAVSPNTREYEAAIVVKARPQRVHLAMLLCGYEPGHPLSWDDEAKKIIPATGDPLELFVQWTDPKTQKEKTAPVEDWMTATDPAKPMPHLAWIFTGSRRLEDGQYLADIEGSVVSITNLPDAVIDLAGRHVKDWEKLEFKLNKTVAPPDGTPCTLIIQPPASLRIELDRFGKLLIHGRVVEAKRLADLLAAHRKSRDNARVELVVSPDAIPADADALLAACAKAGFPADRIEKAAPSSQPDSKDKTGASAFPANDPAAAWDLLTAQWARQETIIQANVAAQEQWFAQLRDRGDLFARQVNELTGYLGRTQAQYRQAVNQLRSQP